MDDLFLQQVIQIIMFDADDDEVDDACSGTVLQHLPAILPNGDYERPKNIGYFEMVVPFLSDLQYQKQFRLGRDGVLTLINHIRPFIDVRFQETSLEKQVHFLLWYCATMQSFRECSQIFGFDDATAWRIIHRLTEVVASRGCDFIKWPNNAECQRIEQGFHLQT